MLTLNLLQLPPMNDFSHRFALVVLLSCGLLSITLVPWSSSVSAAWEYPSQAVAWNLLPTQHWQTMLAILAVGLAASAFVPALRPGAISAAVLSKVAYITLAALEAPVLPATAWWEAAMCVALLAAAGVLAREAWQEARWDGRAVLPLRPEA